MASALAGSASAACRTAVRCPQVAAGPPRADVACPGALPSRRRALRYAIGFTALIGGWGAQAGLQPAKAATQSPMEKVLDNPNWPEEYPLKADDFARYDESPDANFYQQPRFVTHIDDGAIHALTQYYETVFPPSGQKDTALLDICSSWISHYPEGYKAGKISGLGMNAAELERNPALTDWTVRDLNKDPTLPYDDNTFDVVTNAVSVDYLTRPLEIFDEVHRVLKPGGLAVMSFSNRCFPTKAISIWTSSSDSEHIWIVGSYFHYSAGGKFEEPKCKDISPRQGFFGGGDPMYVVYSRKKV
ncbi:unnamed protein product [Ostreobium quekettii]|uniref:Methyltransferase type 11 domain-containing protein n=1 Tax=Ostreobium quekettii TaxID=121088 RepID=A0A8S1JFE6_9CHLO|nr:unnamed protein product [Ostreobium quekettii]|eukprot:evm.model.scf_666.8 EVM.evm.TU.scf_666.8   scf_666:35487-38171(+)